MAIIITPAPGGGPGTTPDWATVLGAGANLGNDVSSDGNNFDFEMSQLSRYTITAEAGAYKSTLNLSSTSCYIGSQNGSTNSCFIYFEPGNALCYTSFTQGDGNAKGFLFNFADESYAFGDVSGVSNGTRLEIQDQTTRIITFADTLYFREVNTGSGAIEFDATSGYVSNSAGSNTSLHLRVRIGGTYYKIQLKNN
jgi:hypothetical protein